ncbi:latent-transforming growth factor beta-binding protein 2 isoform X1 [Thunnus albacares]|uniref:latent-transforming growth factor beta-binding protein 2 isoform X1 n=2 Tax=Thunnus albacares TaxID=8236 RepID=UPI001CF70FBD|nr:latent-transforming growth factor beta-binding protein 2 isoform X1 [Thunnus albacares]
MRLRLLMVWMVTLHLAAAARSSDLQPAAHPHWEEEGVHPWYRHHQTRWKRQSTGTHSPLRLDATKPAAAAVRGTGAKLRGGQPGVRRREALTGPHVCGDTCCAGWTFSPKTRRCTKPRCLPPCRNRALCWQPNQCRCRSGFHGSRCEFSTLTSILPTSVPHRSSVHFNLSYAPPQPTLAPLRNTKPAILPPPAPTRAAETPKTTSKSQNPSSTQAETTSGAKSGVKTEVVPARSEDKGGVSKRFLLQYENQASPKSPQTGRRAERMEEVKMKSTTESKPGLNNLRPWTRDTADTEEGAEGLKETLNLKSPNPEGEREERVAAAFNPGSQTQDRPTKNPNVELLSRSTSDGKVSLDLHESSETGEKTLNRQTDSETEVMERLTTSLIPNLEFNTKSKLEKGQYLESNSGSKVEHRLNIRSNLRSESEESVGISKVEFNAEPNVEQRRDPESVVGFKVEKRLVSSKIPKLESNPGPRGGEEVADVAERSIEGRRTKSEEKKKKEVKKQTLSLREAQAVLLRKTLSRGGRGDKMAALLMKHIEKERKKLVTSSSSSSNSSSSSSSSSPASSSSSSSSVKTRVKTFYTQKGQYTVHVTAPAADGQTVTGGGGGGGGGGGVDRFKVMFTPTICKVRCSLDRCVNYCERGNVTTLYSSSSEAAAAAAAGGRRDVSHGPGFRVFLCPLLCKNGGVCLQKDRCICPPNFTGKFCQIPVTPTAAASAAAAAAAAAASAAAATAPASAPAAAAAAISPSSTNEIVKPALLSAAQELTQSEFLLPLGGQSQEAGRSGAPGPSMVKVRVQHPPEASVKIHQVLKVSRFSPQLQALSSSTQHSGSAGAPAPASRVLQAQTVRADTQYSGFKYCFREVKDGQCSSPLPGLRSRDTCCRGIGKAWGITDCVLCPANTGQSNSSCPVGFERGNGTQCVDVNECLQPGLCENGICVNTGGSYSCVCRQGFILDALHGICISQSVISEEKGQCYRVLGSGQGPSSCSLPILRNITKQICCCSRVGKAWGPNCQRCPYFGSVAFKEICPAGPGYHYSASALQFNHRVNDLLGGQGAPLVPHGNQDIQGPGSGSNSSGASTSQSRPTQPQQPQTRPQPPPQQPRPPPQQPRPPPQQPRPPPQQPRPPPQQPRPPPQQPRPPPQQPRPPPQQPRPSPQQPRPQPPPQQPRPQPPPQQPRPQPQPQQPQPRPATDSSSSRPVRPGGAATTATQDKPPTPGRVGVQPSRPDPTRPVTAQQRPQPPFTGSQAGGRPSSVSRPDQPAARGDSLPAPPQPQSPERASRPGGEFPPVQSRPAVTTTTRPTRVQTVRGVCESRPGVCGRGRCVDQPGGKYTCVCDQGFQPTSQGTYCQDVNECVQSPGVCAVGECANSIGSYRCVCPAGYRSNSQQTSCHDIDECQQNPCSNARCDNTPGSYRCVCRLGYRLSGTTCTDVDECEDPLQCPGQECRNSPGSYRCVSCQPGYALVNSRCTDIDECRQVSCSNGRCDNTPGSYRCVCHHGYRLQNNTCTDVDECAEPSQCPGQMCVNSVGSYRCVSCQPGYTLTNRQCTDIDECARGGACDEEQVCVNTFGSFRCECLPGYRTSGLGRQCRDINECLEGDFCFSRGECVNTVGSYTCVCSQGFTLSDNRTACLDVDECEKSDVCQDGRCVNTEGSFHCQCQTGFTTNPERTTCLDIDECVSSGGSVCGSQRCENTIGSYRCFTSCEPGYQVTQTGRCADINECVNKTVCGDHAICQNLVGTYQCVCDQGFTSTADGKACVDEDECVSLLGVCGSARCENVEGSFMCECDRRGEEFDAATRKCVNTARQAETAPVYPSSSSSSSSSPSSHPVSVVDLPSLPAARPGELRECYYNLADRGTCSLLATNTSQQECCCTVGEGWGLGCQYHTCPPIDTAEFLSLCPSGKGYVTTAAGAFSYRDVDECKRFHPEVCKNGVCVNNIPGYNCYCPSGYVYNSKLLECVDHDECEEESCVGGVCVNTVGSYYCSCPSPLVLDDTQRNCVNSSHLTADADENQSVCWQHVTADLMCQSPLLGAQVTFMDCCCLYGEGWGMECALCPSSDSEDYASLCSSVLPPLYSESFPDSTGSETGLRPGGGRGGGGPPYFSPYSPDSFPPAVLPGRDFSRPDYDDYSPVGGSRSGFRGRTPATFSVPDGGYGRSDYSTGYYSEGEYNPPDGSPPRPPSFHLPPDPRAERAFGARPPPPSRSDGPPLSLAPLPGASYEEQEEEDEEPWRPGPPFPPFSESRGAGGGGGGGAGAGGGGGAPRRVYERRYESYAGLSTAEDCGILHGCENGRCIRVAEGYTCDCYQGYELDMTSMTCIDINECEDGVSVEFPCVNARCVNTEGSFRCVCRRGYIMSRRPNHCVAA